MTPVFIYSLNCPFTGRPRYIGKTVNPDSRLAAHLCPTNQHSNKHLKNWINLILSRDEKPVMEILDVVPDSEWIFWEKEYIQNFRELGHALINLTEGGEGLCNPTEETRKKMGDWQRGEKNSMYGKPSWNRGRKATLEERENSSLAQTGLKRPPRTLAYRQACGLRQKGILKTEAQKTAMRVPKSKAGWGNRSLVQRARQQRIREEKSLTPEGRAKLAAARKDRWVR